MVRRYAHLSTEHRANYVDRVSRLRLVGAGNVATATAGEMKKGYIAVTL